MKRLLFLLPTIATANDGLDFESNGRTCIAFAVFTEARGESMLGQIAVAEVIKERIEEQGAYTDPCDVVMERNQFHGIREWPQGKLPWNADKAAWNIALEITDGVMLGELSSGCGKAVYFQSSKLKAPRKTKHICTVGNHSLYSDNK